MWIVTALTPTANPLVAAHDRPKPVVVRSDDKLKPVVLGPRGLPARCLCCERKRYGHGFCRPHWRQYVVGRRVLVKQGLCTVPGCNREAHARGYCTMHWSRWRRNGDPLVVLPGGRRPSATPGKRTAYQRAYRERRRALQAPMKARWRQLGDDAREGLR